MGASYLLLPNLLVPILDVRCLHAILVAVVTVNNLYLYREVGSLTCFCASIFYLPAHLGPPCNRPQTYLLRPQTKMQAQLCLASADALPCLPVSRLARDVRRHFLTPRLHA